MRFLTTFALAAALLSSVGLATVPHTVAKRGNLAVRGSLAKRVTAGRSDGSTAIITPKVMIVSIFSYEAAVWYGIKDFNLFGINVTVPGLSPVYPEVYCTADGQICQVTTGEAEINAATSTMALVLSSYFNLTSTYFMIAGIAGINPACGTTGSVSFAKYAVQIGLEYEIDAREIPANFSTGYISLGTSFPEQYPIFLYGTEVFELNANLQDRVYAVAKQATLSDSADAKAYRAKYPSAPANQPPTVIKGDVMTSDVYWSGAILGNAFNGYFQILTNGSGKYCMTADEDNAITGALFRAARFGVVDFSRVISMRTASDFDRPPPGITVVDHLFSQNQGGFVEATANIYLAGVMVVNDIVKLWDSVYKKGFRPGNYIGDIFDSLKGPVAPDIGTLFSQVG